MPRTLERQRQTAADPRADVTSAASPQVPSAMPESATMVLGMVAVLMMSGTVVGLMAATDAVQGMLAGTAYGVSAVVAILTKNMVPVRKCLWLAPLYLICVAACGGILDPTARALCANTALWGALRLLMLKDVGGGLSTTERLAFLVMMTDVDLATMLPAERPRWRAAFSAVGMQAVVVGLAALSAVAGSALGGLLGTACHGLTVFLGLVALDYLYKFVFATTGAASVASMNAPYLSTTLQEFWGVRWNRVAGRMTKALYRRVLRAGYAETVGVLVVFFISGFFHALGMAFSGLSIDGAVMLCGFFVLQGVLCLVEKAVVLPLTSNPYLLRLWTFTALLASAPLFVRPVSSIFKDA
eukprot:TRINITY_DN21252_c0_g1_i1.p1 TRINITY_DN21252_c0_g1~~TRINITY_DN21252_c0_g1_i1.p1  ORF type:complete len:356 (+),score=70.94 TRINITY_DN21252_c0_g1_i1:39-1106(+)